MKSGLLLFLVACLGISIALNIYFFTNMSASKQLSNSGPSDIAAQLAAKGSESPVTNETSALQREGNTVGSNGALNKAAQIEQIELWLESGQYSVARDVIQRYLQESPQDLEFLMLEAQLIDLTADIAEVLAHYYSLLDVPLEDAQRVWVLQRIESLTGENVRKLRGINAWDILATFLEPLWQFDPTNKSIIVVLAEAYARLESESLMEYVLASLLPDDPDVIRIRALLRDNYETPVAQQDSVPQEQSFDRGIGLVRRGDHFLVDARMGSKKMRLMIDTGASTTVLTDNAFARLSSSSFSEFVGNYRVNTAGGLITAPIYRIRNLSIADYKVNDIAIVVLPMESFSEADGLLGMNYLREFDFWIDQREAQLFLKE